MLTTTFFKIRKTLLPFSLVLLIQLYFSTVYAQTTTTTVNPDWTDNADWSLTAPTYDLNQDAIIANNSSVSTDIKVLSGTTLTINAGITLTTNKKITVEDGGTLIINGTITGTADEEFKIDKGTLIVNSGGTLEWTGDWKSESEEASITIDGIAIVDGDFFNKDEITGSGGIDVGGTLNNNGGTIFGCADPGADCCPSGSCILPIELIAFHGVADKAGIDIYWSTAAEINNDFFTIERSRDGINWEVIHFTKGAGNSSEIMEYAFVDFEPPIGLVYYRLKQTDFDGAFSYLKKSCGKHAKN